MILVQNAPRPSSPLDAVESPVGARGPRGALLRFRSEASYFPRSPRMYGSPSAAGAPIRLRVASREPITSTMIVNA